MTIREMITELSEEVRTIENPHRAAEILVSLTSLLSSLNKEITEALYWYKLKKLELLREHGSASKATIYAEATKEWKDWQDRLSQGKATEELIRSLKYFLRNAESEMKL